MQKALDKKAYRLYNIEWLAYANSYFVAICRREDTMTLRDAKEGVEYIIKSIETDDEELDSFLFSLGCYSGEPITVVSHLRRSCVVSIKDGRYNIDKQLAEAIII